MFSAAGKATESRTCADGIRGLFEAWATGTRVGERRGWGLTFTGGSQGPWKPIGVPSNSLLTPGWAFCLVGIATRETEFLIYQFLLVNLTLPSCHLCHFLSLGHCQGGAAISRWPVLQKRLLYHQKCPTQASLGKARLRHPLALSARRGCGYP